MDFRAIDWRTARWDALAAPSCAMDSSRALRVGSANAAKTLSTLIMQLPPASVDSFWVGTNIEKHSVLGNSDLQREWPSDALFGCPANAIGWLRMAVSHRLWSTSVARIATPACPPVVEWPWRYACTGTSGSSVVENGQYRRSGLKA